MVSNQTKSRGYIDTVKSYQLKSGELKGINEDSSNIYAADLMGRVFHEVENQQNNEFKTGEIQLDKQLQ